ncbi:PQQ-dependent catabolism-associated CXXCW motif protein [Paracoccus pacificus]|uniref:PQQ-dependent catabolism-associated CXXCW motif protein n=1 Tax=Paracoccus pacificus TaxID=1463598 RepID=A0ABW4R487_9RHOB
MRGWLFALVSGLMVLAAALPATAQLMVPANSQPSIAADANMAALLAARLRGTQELGWEPPAEPEPKPRRPTVPEPDNYRAAPYFGPVPATLSGATVVDAVQARQLHDQGVPFVDVLPRPMRPDDTPLGTIWVEPQHMTIPGALWLADTGYETLTTPQMATLKQGLIQASHGNLDGRMVFFCSADCWMSWNAARRAVEMGYTGVIWFPDGTDGWQENGDALTPVMPDGP